MKQNIDLDGRDGNASHSNTFHYFEYGWEVKSVSLLSCYVYQVNISCVIQTKKLVTCLLA